ncbi:MAG: hypothetical protein BV457_07150 [Thermoplasmata archaeon M9B1D]|nr:MAG: hypothetical protein BV457_07150 [Thermoplasmata archaeon M9B1D]
MNKKLSKKILIIIIIGSIFLTTLPALNAEIIDKNNIFSQNKDNDNENSEYDLLIISPNKFSRALKPLVEHKNHNNVPTYFVSLENVYEVNLLGRDQPEKIKLFIKDSIENYGIKYVLLVGYFRDLPVRYVYNSPQDEERYISELYYADIYDKNGNFSSWDTNNDGIYGEWDGTEAQDKDIDLYPDVYVGRLACRNILEVKIMVDKIITYETSTYNSNWFNHIVVCAGDTYPDGQYPFPTPDFEGEENAKTVLSYMPGFSNTSLFTSDGSFKGPSDIINAIDQGCGFLFFDGHANPMVWSTHPPNNHTWVNGLTIFDMSDLSNKKMLPVCVVGGCHNLQFDVNLINLLKDFKEAYYWSIWYPECWGWKLTRKIGGGSIATLGCSGLGMTKEDKSTLEGASDYLDSQFFYEYGINGTDILGEVWGNAITNYLEKYPIDWNTKSSWDYAYDAKTVQQWVLLGDPSLKIGGYP